MFFRPRRTLSRRRFPVERAGIPELLINFPSPRLVTAKIATVPGKPMVLSAWIFADFSELSVLLVKMK
jgi:hypothetical protein